MNISNQIHQSWEENAATWIKTIRQEQIKSRKITNRAVVRAITNHLSGPILDLGCGEGWLCRELTQHGIETLGLDANQSLINAAREFSGSSNFENITYQELIDGVAKIHPSDQLKTLKEKGFRGAVFNFSLYEKEGIDQLLRAVTTYLCRPHKLVIQTIHPSHLRNKGLSYQSQWIKNSWEGLDSAFKNGHPWFLRTLEDWILIFYSCQLNLEMIYEPLSGDSKEPVSIIFILNGLKK
ncbi:class I SAM-dependent methyltransferase [Algoriphagus sp.]|uniref:class I SAM-dependent methyltransferase n=1 Tax=Algoriphagus sp. TaxID=1872435 RepID=UPI002607F333|nr:class I SAM-dependent methyltransferase [Algoriphagus sp.]